MAGIISDALSLVVVAVATDAVIIVIGVVVLLAVGVIGLVTHGAVTSQQARTPWWTKDRK